MSLSGLIGVVALALLEGALVALPRGRSLKRVERLRSPAWSALFPGSIVLGTFGVIVMPSMAYGLLVLAAVATPVLAFVSVFAVVRRGRRAFVIVALALGVVAEFAGGWSGELSASVLTALGCLALGTALVRLIPFRWIPIGVLAMCATDVVLLVSGAGATAGGLMADAMASFHGPMFAHAAIGSISTDYPDLVLAAILGEFVAGQPVQRLAAVLVTALATGYGLLLPVASMLPATVPVALTLILLRWVRLPGSPLRLGLQGARAGLERARASLEGARAS